MNTLFEIRGDDKMHEDQTLLMEIGPDYCSYAYLHQPTNTINTLQFISYKEKELDESLPVLLQTLLQQPIKNVYVSSAFPQAMLVPTKYFNEDYKLLNELYSVEQHHHFHDKINDWQMVNVYAVPKGLHRHISTAFPDANFYHVYSPAIQVYNGYVADNQLIVHFTPGSIRVLQKCLQ